MAERYSNVIRIVPVYAVEEVKDAQVKLKPGYNEDSIICAHTPEPSEKVGNSAAKCYNLFSLHVRVEKLSSEQSEKYGMQSEVILILYEKKDNIEPLVVGSMDNPVTMIHVPDENGDFLSFTRSSFIPVL